jgi:GH25 family lysozyme M1 (1,4-beta-N-acetylmuramidase)
MEFRGIDVSKWQGNIDWNRVKASGVDFAILRAGYGSVPSQKDVTFEDNYQNAKAAGVPVGAYHYSYAKDIAGAKREAQTFLEWIKGKQFEYPVVFDIEESATYNLGRNTVSEIIKTFCSIVEAAGYYVSVYTNKNWLDHVVSDEVKSKYDTWLAQWTSTPSYVGPYGMWQYTSSGTVDGISGRVDMDIAYKNYPEIIKRKQLNGWSGADVPQTSESHAYAAGKSLALNNTPIYISATSKKIAGYKSGTYYVYDGNVINGRIRITNSAARVGKKPASENVTGYMEV